MNKKTSLILSLLLMVFTAFGSGLNDVPAEACTTDLDGAEEIPCNCDEIPEPYITFSVDPANCDIKFIANNYAAPCGMATYFSWSVDGGAYVSTGTTSTYTFSTIDDVTSVQLQIAYSNLGTPGQLCTRTAFRWFENYTCANAQSAGGLTIMKEAYNSNGTVPVTSVYQGTGVDWLITIDNTSTEDISVNFNDIFILPPGTTDPPCGWTLVNASEQLFNNGNPTGQFVDTSMGFPLSENPLIMSPGINTITIETVAPNNANCVGLYTNCANVSYVVSGETFFEESCSQVQMVYGCPIGMTDGFCLDETELEAGDELVSYFNGHTEFEGVKSITGRLTWDPEKVEDPVLALDPAITGFNISTDPLGPGVADFTISSFSPTNTFNIGLGYPWQTFNLTAELKNNLTNCTVFNVTNVLIDDGFGDPTPVFVDPGKFCLDFPAGYDELVIGVSPSFDACASTSDPVTLEALGPFNSEDPSTIISWKRDGIPVGSDPELTITVGGNYTLDVIDSTGCERTGSIEIESCGDCNCADLNPVILTSVDGCEVDAIALIDDCFSTVVSGGSALTFEWEFNNYNNFEWTGQDPPPVSFAGPYGSPKIKLTVYATGNDGVCEPVVVYSDPFVACRSSKSKMYPNPARDQVNLDISDQFYTTGSLKVLNSTGLTLKEMSFDTSLNGSVIGIDTSGLTPGLYFVQILDDTGSIIEVKRLAIK